MTERREGAGPLATDESQNPIPSVAANPWQRIGIVLICVAYAAVSGYFACRHLLGDPLSHPTAYFFTWNMFPGYTTETSRRRVVGLTASGRHIQILPANNHHFRWGINNEVARIDVDRRLENLKPEIEKSLRRFNQKHADDPILRILFVETFWPNKYNLPDDFFQATYDKPNSHPRYWRVLESATVDVSPDGVPDWGPSP